MNQPAKRTFSTLACIGGLAIVLLAGSVAATGTAVYSYDAWGRLTSVTYANGRSTAYTYDAAGNRTVVVTATPPVASPVALVVAANSTSNAIPLAVAGAYTSVAVTTSPTHGSTSIAGTTISYRPSTNYAGPDSLAYTVTGSGGVSAPAAVAVAVSPFARSAFPSVAAYSVSNPITLSITGTYTSVAVSSFANHGAAIPGGTTMTYTPNPGYWGSDQFKYTASNSVATSQPGSVIVTVNPPPPIALPVSATVPNQGAQPVPLSFSPTGIPVTSVAVTTGASHGTATASGATISYTGDGSFVGFDNFQYTGTNVGGTSAPATATLTVIAWAQIQPGVSSSGKYSYYTFPLNFVTTTGGSGSYTYLWSETNDGEGNWTTGGTSSSFAPAVSSVLVGSPANAIYKCTVTDTVTHAVATTNIALYEWTNTGS